MGLFNRKKRKTPDRTPAPEVATSPDPTSAIHQAFDDLVDREWARLAEPGTWWTGKDRVALAQTARAALEGQPLPGILTDPVEQMVRRVTVDAASIRPPDVAAWQADGEEPLALVELVGVVSRLAGIDTATFGLGYEPRPLPDPKDGDPTQIAPDGVGVTTGWLPTSGPASAPSALSAVPAEAEAMFDVHGVLYATIEQMGELQLEREGLSRPQIELVAARTSALNECFY